MRPFQAKATRREGYLRRDLLPGHPRFRFCHHVPHTQPQNRSGASIFAPLHPQFKRDLGSSASAPPQPPPKSGPSLSSPPGQTQFPLVSAPLPRRSLFSPLANSTPTLAVFLKNLMGSDFSAHHDLLEAQGFTLPRLHIVAGWDREAIGETVSRLLMGSVAGHKGLSAFEVVSLELAIRKLKSKIPGPAPLPSRSVLLPPSVNPNNSTATIAAFLKNVMGFDLSAHRELLEAQGFDLARLCAITGWERGDLQELLRRTLSLKGDDAELGLKNRMSALEVLALEFAIWKVKG
ncbi:hypothetical protein DFH09DRAFT_1189839 [Mycena vulgaris]|nr:hypothetical protein DFH09DRAFT_1189839 [Mycena vulgaris]